MNEILANRINKGRKILFDPSDECFTNLLSGIEKQSHKTLILWAWDLAEISVQALSQKYIGDNRPLNALNLSKQWATGEVKMSAAKKAILECHAMAKEINDISDVALCHAVGQACSVVHTETHAMGYPVYELTAIVRKYGSSVSDEAVKQRVDFYLDRLLFWRNGSGKVDLRWASFITEK